MLSLGYSIVVSATPEILCLVKPQLANVSRDVALSMPFIYGRSLYYLPDPTKMSFLDSPGGFQYELIKQKNIPELYAADFDTLPTG